MSTTAFERVVSALEQHGRVTGSGNRRQAQCPAHDDRQASLSVTGTEGQALIYCHAGCDTAAVLGALGLSMSDLYDTPKGAAYRYGDGRMVHRSPDKRFRQSGNTKGAELYRAGDVAAAVFLGQPVYVVEGEKDVHALESLGVTATCSAMGAGKAHKADWSLLAKATVFVVADRDPPGEKHARDVCGILTGLGATVHMVRAKVGKDAADHVAAGHGVADFEPSEKPRRSSVTDVTSVTPLIRQVTEVTSVTDTGPASVDGAAVLDELHTWLRGYVAFPSEAVSVAVTLWCAHTHLVGYFDSTPRLSLLSPEKQCGKTRVLELVELVCPGAERLGDASPAYMFRRISAGAVTVLLDEVDTVFKRGKADEGAEALRGIINAGHRKGAYIGRVAMVGQAAQLERHEVYAPVALAGIGKCLPDTILDRSVIVTMRRRAPDEPVRDYRERITRPEGEALHKRLAEWADTVADRIGQSWPEMPKGVADRPADVWEPLLTVADHAGGHWPTLARDACTTFVKASGNDTATIGVRLLADLRDLFGDAPALSTETILGKLHALEEAPWADWYGQRFTARNLAAMLKPYDIKPKVINFGDTTARGYASGDLRDAWQRYLSPPDVTDVTSVTPLIRQVTEVTSVTDTGPATVDGSDASHRDSQPGIDECCERRPGPQCVTCLLGPATRIPEPEPSTPE